MSDDADDKPSESLERSDNLATPSVQTKKKKIRRGVRPRVETRRRKRNPTQNKKPSIIVRARTHIREREKKKGGGGVVEIIVAALARASFLEYLFIPFFLSIPH